MGAGVGLVLGDDLIGMFIAQHMAGEVGDHKADGGVPEAALSAEEAAPEAEVLSEAEPPQPASMAADIASAIERASAFFIFVFSFLYKSGCIAWYQPLTEPTMTPWVKNFCTNG